MAIAGVIISVAQGSTDSFVQTVQALPELTLGAQQGHVFPAVLDTADERQGAAMMEAIAAVDGVLRVEIVSVDFEDQNREDMHETT